eukprot:TRINITY_DN39655_c0_g1_i1.p1 TRINITY_DN39655_c0_g1~~TRINITY_DN39655_c0_g1_i1.p1  ORF type:complete len:203 (+),score=55.87 TRINITY_DN39655_c0_g1_i1:229-837(+)
MAAAERAKEVRARAAAFIASGGKVLASEIQVVACPSAGGSVFQRGGDPDVHPATPAPAAKLRFETAEPSQADTKQSAAGRSASDESAAGGEEVPPSRKFVRAAVDQLGANCTGEEYEMWAEGLERIEDSMASSSCGSGGAEKASLSQDEDAGSEAAGGEAAAAEDDGPGLEELRSQLKVVQEGQSRRMNRIGELLRQLGRTP